MDSQTRLSPNKENLEPMNHAFPKQQAAANSNLAPKLRENSYTRVFET